GDPVGQMRGDVPDVLVDYVPGILAGHHQLAEVLVAHVPDYADGQVALGVEHRGGAVRLGLLLDRLPLGGEPGNVPGQLLLGGSLGRGAHDDARILRHHLLEDLLEAVAFGVRQLATDSGHRRAGHVDQVPPWEADLAGQPGPLVTDRVLGDLHDHRLARFERPLDALGLG